MRPQSANRSSLQAIVPEQRLWQVRNRPARRRPRIMRKATDLGNNIIEAAGFVAAGLVEIAYIAQLLADVFG